MQNVLKSEKIRDCIIIIRRGGGSEKRATHRQVLCSAPLSTKASLALNSPPFLTSQNFLLAPSPLPMEGTVSPLVIS